MSKHFKPAGEIVGEKARVIHALWEKVRDSRIAPKRKEITLSLVRDVTPWMWIIDVVDDGADFRFRLAGDRIVQFLGYRNFGVLLSELPASPFYDAMGRILTQCFEAKEPLALGPVRSNHPGKEHWEVEIVVLPLSEDGERISALFGTMELWPLGTNSGEN